MKSHTSLSHIFYDQSIYYADIYNEFNQVIWCILHKIKISDAYERAMLLQTDNFEISDFDFDANLIDLGFLNFIYNKQEDMVDIKISNKIFRLSINDYKAKCKNFVEALAVVDEDTDVSIKIDVIKEVDIAYNFDIWYSFFTCGLYVEFTDDIKFNYFGSSDLFLSVASYEIVVSKYARVFNLVAQDIKNLYVCTTIDDFYDLVSNIDLAHIKLFIDDMIEVKSELISLADFILKYIDKKQPCVVYASIDIENIGEDKLKRLLNGYKKRGLIILDSDEFEAEDGVNCYKLMRGCILA